MKICLNNAELYMCIAALVTLFDLGFIGNGRVGQRDDCRRTTPPLSAQVQGIQSLCEEIDLSMVGRFRRYVMKWMRG